ncbi:hypothetical protein CCUS01_03727 [Colletotrichum cuscutae]|uniref:Uncharacterized protein n=1 Tax=Colletotrichum cuscutae TaxID=1209917 RepID=A0AAI9VIC8_9PEZI|nr:hypothetical protein CCUS01_03727 [Colletotrichum cuscutae]
MHTLTAVREHDGYESLSIHDRINIVLTLVEASRFSGMEWKRLAISQAKATMCGLQDQYADSCIAQRECWYPYHGDIGRLVRTVG